MSTDDAESAPRRPRRTGSARRPSRVLFKSTPVVGAHSNHTSATSLTRNKVTIQVSFVFKRPPQASNLFVDCSDLNPDVPPEIVCSVDDLLLLCVNVGRGVLHDLPEDYDYFVYRADSSGPSLELLPHPHPLFDHTDVGLLPRSDGYYVAALMATGNPHLYQLHVFDSKTLGWSSSMLSVEKPFPVKIPGDCDCDLLLRHYTTTVITIGGKSGTLGWVDLWSGILLCDVLGPEPSLRVVPLPLPEAEMRDNSGMGFELGYPGDCRGISYIRDKGCLKFVHLEITGLSYEDEETWMASFQVDDWALTTWSNKLMSDSLKDWHQERRVQASKIKVDDRILRVLENSGLLRRPRDNEANADLRDLHNLYMYQPTPCSSGEDVVYLLARKKFMHPKAWMLAVDMKNGGKLQDVAFLGNQEHCFSSLIYCPSRISKYIFPKNSINPATTPVPMDGEESNGKAGAKEARKMRRLADDPATTDDFSSRL